MEEEMKLMYEELMMDGTVIIGKRRKDGRWDAKTYRILKYMRERAAVDGWMIYFDKTDGSVTIF